MRTKQTEAPAARSTLAEALSSRKLPSLDRALARATLGGVESCAPGDEHVRRASSLILRRIQQFYKVVRYTGPDYVFGKVDSEYPDAYSASSSWCSYNQMWVRERLCYVHPACGAKRLFQEAGDMCLDSACAVAVEEICAVVPEAEKALRYGHMYLRHCWHSTSISGVRWSDSRRRLGTPGIRKMLALIAMNLDDLQPQKNARIEKYTSCYD